MSDLKKILIVFGTRPEAIKMAPLVKELQKHPDKFDVSVCVTGQHRQMLDQVLDIFEIKPDFDLNIMKPNQDLSDITANVLLGMRDILTQSNPDLVLVHGDTTTSAATALSAFYRQIPVGHVEAGLRTRNIYNPWPEEINRQITGRIATYHFAPTELSKKNLLDESVGDNCIFVTGNTVIDALLSVVERLKNDSNLSETVNSKIAKSGFNPLDARKKGRKIVLITGHRRENFGEGFKNICLALKDLSSIHPDVDFVYPMHLNPNVRGPIQQLFGQNPPNNLHFIDPLEYISFVYLMEKSDIILTDSGGIQEEAPGLGKPVLVMRETTERPEALAAGTVRLVGTDKNKIVHEIGLLLEDKNHYNKMSVAQNPYGDGKACSRIADILAKGL